MRFVPGLAALLLTIPAAVAAQGLPTFTTPAPIAYMKDLSNGMVLFAKEPDTPMPPASMGKMMTVYVAFDMISRGEAKLDQKIRVRPETWAKWHSQGSTMFLSPNEEVTVADLLHGIITLSGNDACVTLAEGLAGTEEAYVGLMNRAAQKMGLRGSTFANTSGWPDPGERVTARDLATIAERTVTDFPKLYQAFYPTPSFTWGKTLGKGDAITQPNRNPLLGRVQGADGLKTGHTEEAGYGFTGSAIRDGRRLVMVIAGLGSFNERIAQSVAFMEWGFGAWTQVPVVNFGQVVGTAKVWMGDKSEVGLTGATALKVTVPRGYAGAKSAKIVYQGPVQAPIKKGQHIANLIVTIPGLPPSTLPLVAAEAVGEANPFQRLLQWLGSLVS